MFPFGGAQLRVQEVWNELCLLKTQVDSLPSMHPSASPFDLYMQNEVRKQFQGKMMEYQMVCNAAAAERQSMAFGMPRMPLPMGAPPFLPPPPPPLFTTSSTTPTSSTSTSSACGLPLPFDDVNAFDLRANGGFQPLSQSPIDLKNVATTLSTITHQPTTARAMETDATITTTTMTTTPMAMGIGIGTAHKPEHSHYPGPSQSRAQHYSASAEVATTDDSTVESMPKNGDTTNNGASVMDAMAAMHSTEDSQLKLDLALCRDYEDRLRTSKRGFLPQWAQCAACAKWRVHFISAALLLGADAEVSLWKAAPQWECSDCANPKYPGVCERGCEHPQESPTSWLYDSIELTALKFQRHKQVVIKKMRLVNGIDEKDEDKGKGKGNGQVQIQEGEERQQLATAMQTALPQSTTQLVAGGTDDVIGCTGISQPLMAGAPIATGSKGVDVHTSVVAKGDTHPYYHHSRHVVQAQVPQSAPIGPLHLGTATSGSMAMGTVQVAEDNKENNEKRKCMEAPNTMPLSSMSLPMAATMHRNLSAPMPMATNATLSEWCMDSGMDPFASAHSLELSRLGATGLSPAGDGTMDFFGSDLLPSFDDADFALQPFAGDDLHLNSTNAADALGFSRESSSDPFGAFHLDSHSAAASNGDGDMAMPTTMTGTTMEAQMNSEPMDETAKMDTLKTAVRSKAEVSVAVINERIAAKRKRDEAMKTDSDLAKIGGGFSKLDGGDEDGDVDTGEHERARCKLQRIGETTAMFTGAKASAAIVSGVFGEVLKSATETQRKCDSIVEADNGAEAVLRGSESAMEETEAKQQTVGETEA